MDNKIEALNASTDVENRMGDYYVNKYIFFSVPSPGYVYMQVHGPQDQLFLTDVGDLMLKDIHYNYFAFEIVHQDEASVF